MESIGNVFNSIWNAFCSSATALYAICGLLVVLLVAWRAVSDSIGRFFRRDRSRQEQESEDPLALTARRSEEIIQAYGAAIAEYVPSPTWIVDASKLPYPKEAIKEAITWALKVSDDDDHTRGMLMVSYIQLADWQDGVGETRQGINPSDLGNEAVGDVSKRAETLAAQLDAYAKTWKPIVDAEEAQLKQELIDLGL